MLILTNSANIEIIYLIHKLFNIYFNSINYRLICFAMFYKLYIFAEEKTKKMNYSLEQFREMIWDDYISEFTISTPFIEKNREFLDEVTFDVYRLFRMHKGDIEEKDIVIMSRILESFIINSFRYRPDQEDIHRGLDY